MQRVWSRDAGICPKGLMRARPNLVLSFSSAPSCTPSKVPTCLSPSFPYSGAPAPLLLSSSVPGILRTFTVRPLTFRPMANQSSLLRSFSTEPAKPAEPKPEDETTSKKKSGQGRTWKEIYEVHKDEFFNVFMGALLIILTLRMLRDKGDRLEESKEQTERIKELEDELERVKGSIEDSVQGGTADLAKAFGLRASKVDDLKAKIMELVSAGIEKAAVVPPAVNLVESKAPETLQTTETPAAPAAPEGEKPARKGLF